MSEFSEQVRRWTRQTTTRSREVFVNVANHVHRSVQTGSETTGAPGQPVDTGALRNSWQLTFESTEALISTGLVYAPPIEDGVGPHGPLTLRSEVGGFHSVALTRAGFDRIVELEATKGAR